MVLPSWAGDMLTTTPADCRAEIFSLAPPFPPAMMAPAWPILRPGGAVKPAMKDTTGFEAAPCAGKSGRRTNVGVNLVGIGRSAGWRQGEDTCRAAQGRDAIEKRWKSSPALAFYRVIRNKKWPCPPSTKAPPAPSPVVTSLSNLPSPSRPALLKQRVNHTI